MAGERRPERRLRLLHVYAISTGAMFSSGFFLLPGLAADETGPSMPLAYLLAGLLVLPALLSTAELSTAFPRAGGPYHFFQRSLGPLVAIIGALGLFVAMVLKAAFALVGIGAYLSIVVDVPAEPVAIVLAVVFTLLNVAGARESANLQVGLVALLLAVLGAFVAFGVVEVAGRGTEATTDAFTPFLADGAVGLLAATGLVFVSYAGLLQVASVAGEVRRPGRNIPRGLLLSLGTATFFYVVGTALMVAVLSPEELRDDTTPVATAVEALPFPLGTWIVVLGALAAFASTGNAGIMSASRYPLALARDRLLWRRFARLGRFGTPTLSVLVTGALTVGLVVAFDVESIAKLASAFMLVVFAILNLAVIVLRTGRVAGYQPAFRSPLHPWLQVFGILAAVVLVVDLGLLPALFTVGIVFAGVAWYVVVGRVRTEDEGMVINLLHRLRSGVSDEDVLRRLQEEGPRHDDQAGEVLERAELVRLDPGTGLEAAVSEAVTRLAGRLRVATGEAEQWIAGRRHLALELAPGRVVLHHVLLDSADDPEVVVAFAPSDGDGTRAVAVAIVAGPEHERSRCLRLAALLATQLCDRDLTARWPGSEDVEAVRRMLVRDAVSRQGGDPVR